VRGLGTRELFFFFDIFDAAFRNLGGFQDVVLKTTSDFFKARKRRPFATSTSAKSTQFVVYSITDLLWTGCRIARGPADALGRGDADLCDHWACGSRH
jgi:hypothetical protein